MELYPRFDRLHSQIRQTWRYKVTVAYTYTMLQMHVSSLGGTNTHGKDVRALERDHSISNRFSEWRGNLCRLVACRLHQMYTAAISEAATAKATALTKTGMSFPGQAA